MDIRQKIKTERLILDGGMGSLLQERGLKPGELPERWNVTHKDVITDIHRKYLEAGSDIITANTFGLNGLKYSSEEMKTLCFAAIENARNAGADIVAYDMGPCGRMLKPWGDLEFENAVNIFKEQALLAQSARADLIIIETMADSYETKAALLAVKENTNLPVFVSNAYGIDGKLLTGASPKAMVAMLEGLGVDAIGANCSLGPKQLYNIVKELTVYASIPVFVQPNAGLPCVKDGKTVYDIGPEEFAKLTASMSDLGVSILGGCCGTGPEHIRLLKKELENKPVLITTPKYDTLVSSYSRCVEIKSSADGVPTVIGERINPSGNKKLRAAIESNDMDYVLRIGADQEDAGADILDINVGLPGIDEVSYLSRTVFEMQSVTALPLCIDSSNAEALAKATRLYNGKPIINSVNGKEESLKSVLPIAAKYGGVVICLCLDENGIPDKAEGRFTIAEKIAECAAEYGIERKNLLFDALTMPVSASASSAIETLKTVGMIKNILGCNTVLGVSNISFGLPKREKLNASFFTSALEYGLSTGIINPLSLDMMTCLYSFNALHNNDETFEKYIECMGKFSDKTVELNTAVGFDVTLQTAVTRGLKSEAKKLSENMLETTNPMDIINNEVIPALDIVGKAYEEGKMYLPQLLLSAEAAQSAFEVIKEYVNCSGKNSNNTDAPKKFVLATVKGDIHDIGKNIVKLLLANYGFDVIDLGKDVSKEKILEAVINSNAKLCGLSALMTTTVPAMKETIELIKEKVPDCKIVVGGAVLNKEYAESIGADYYAKDAMATVRFGKVE